MTPNSELKQELNNPKKGVILYLKFLLHFWSCNNSLKITVFRNAKQNNSPPICQFPLFQVNVQVICHLSIIKRQGTRQPFPPYFWGKSNIALGMLIILYTLYSFSTYSCRQEKLSGIVNAVVLGRAGLHELQSPSVTQILSLNASLYLLPAFNFNFNGPLTNSLTYLLTYS